MIKFDKKWLCKIGIHDKIIMHDFIEYRRWNTKKETFISEGYIFNKVCVRCEKVFDEIKKYKTIMKEDETEILKKINRDKKALEIYNKYKAETDG